MNKDEFVKYLDKINIKINEEELLKFEKYKELLKEYNNKFNLTSIIDDESIYLKHFYDSLYLITIEELKKSNNILDIGTGAGFPGIPLSIMLKDKNITLVESNEKKCMFLNVIKNELNLNNIEIVNMRQEDYAKLNREKFDLVTSRAVSNLVVISELEIPCLKVGGYFLPLKSNVEEEIELSKEKINVLGAKILDIIEYTLPIENSKRTILKIEKIKETDKMYPRDYSKIIKDLKKVSK